MWLKKVRLIHTETRKWSWCQLCVTGSTGGCHYDNLRCYQWWQSWHHDNCHVSVPYILTWAPEVSDEQKALVCPPFSVPLPAPRWSYCLRYPYRETYVLVACVLVVTPPSVRDDFGRGDRGDQISPSSSQIASSWNGSSYTWEGLIYLPVFFRVSSLALGQSYGCPIASEVTLKDKGKINQNLTKIKHKHVCTMHRIGTYNRWWNQAKDVNFKSLAPGRCVFL